MLDDGFALDAVAALLARLDAAAPETRLALLKETVIAHGGCWNVPLPRAGRAAPILFEVQVHGLTASSPDPAELPVKWMQLARNTLEAEQRP